MYQEIVKQQYDANNFKETAHKLVDILADYLSRATSGSEDMKVLPQTVPADTLKNWSGNFPLNPNGTKIEELLAKVIEESNHLHHPKYIGHQVSSPLPISALCDMVSSMLNNGMVVYEMGPVSTIMERHVITWLAKQIGWGEESSGVLTSGGSLGNLTALLAARQAKAGNGYWENGAGEEKLAVLVCEQAHYCVKRAAQIMGWGERGAYPVPANSEYSLDADKLEEAYNQASKEGRKVIAVVASSCSTSTGAFDPIDKIADFCEKHNLWLHIDGAHGASMILSEKYKHVLKGIERADSVVWDQHKMMLMPATVTAVLFKRKSDSYSAFAQKASYLFSGSSEEEWYNIGHRTLECTKTMMTLRVYASMMVCGTKFFGDYVTKCCDLTAEFASLLKADSRFELVHQPQGNIICYKYKAPAGINSDSLQKQIRARILDSGKYYLVQTMLDKGMCLRNTIINPLTTIDDIKDMMKEISDIGEEIISSQKIAA